MGLARGRADRALSGRRAAPVTAPDEGRPAAGHDNRAVTRDELIRQTRGLIVEGERLQQVPTLGALRLWLQLSDDLLSAAWGSMDRYHLSWLMVGKPKEIVRGRPMTADEEIAYVREVAEQKTAALRMSLKAVEEQGMPFVGETASVAEQASDRPARLP